MKLLTLPKKKLVVFSFVVDMRKGTYRQKCHDPDCKSFQGIEQTLPTNVTPWLMVVNQEWDNQSPRSMKETL
jgi:hypothetical protein